MIYFIYKKEENNGIHEVACLAINVEDNKVIDTKIIKESFLKDENFSTKWTWSDLTLENHSMLDNFKDSISQDYFFLAHKILDKALSSNIKSSFLNITTGDLIEKFKELEDIDKNIKIEISKNILMFKAFMFFNENPEEIYDFPLFLELKEKTGNSDYMIEDWISDMEELYSEFDND